MKKYINRLAILSGCAVALVACDENSWNDDLDGFEVPVQTETQTIDYTMTSVDYATLAGLKEAKACAGDYQNELKAVGSQGYFTDVITAEEYVPFFLSQERFPYFTLDNGSVVRVTYNTTAGQPDAVVGAVNAEKYTVTLEDYMAAWGSEENYTEAFTPSTPAARNLPKILKAAYPDAASGDYVIVNYNEGATDPVFNAAPEEPAFEMSSVLGSLTKGSTIDIKGYVAAVSTQGPIVTDAAGSVFVYLPTNNSELKVGDQVEIAGASVSTYNYGFQIAKGAEAVVVGNQAVTNPTAKTWTSAEIDAFKEASMAADATPVTPIYSKFTGTVSVSGSYINIILDGTSIQVSPYGANDVVKAEMVDGATVTFEGYVMALASKGKYLNTVITKIGDKTFSALAVNASRAAVSVASENLNAIYKFDGSAWTAPADMVVLNHADYQAMGQKYDNLSGTTPASVIPTYLARKYPYAQADEVRYVVYNYYNGSATVVRCAECVFNGAEWTGGFNGTTVATAQFVKAANKWQYSPDVTITLPAGKGIEISTLYYQTCVDWVAKNVENGAAYVSSYGNNEYYCGTSAYQGNVDLRPSAAKTQYAGYADMTDDEVVALEKTRFESEVFPAALAILHPEAAPTASGIIPVYTINFFYYDGVTKPATIIYHVTAPGKFEFQSCTWND